MEAHKSLDKRAKTIKELAKVVEECQEFSSKLCLEAKEYYDDMYAHNMHLNELIGLFYEIKNKNEDEFNEAGQICEALLDIYQAMADLKSGRMSLTSEAIELEVIEDKITKSDSFKDAVEELGRDQERFLMAYRRAKAKMGLTTQLEVAEKTGLDRRQVSRIERGKHKPQYKTLQKLAAGLEVELEEFLSSSELPKD